MTLGIALFAPPTVIKIPKYLTQGFFAQPIIGNPMRDMTARATITIPRCRYLSESQAAVYMTIAEKKYGGAVRHWDSAMPKPRVVRRTMGRVKAKA